MNHDYERWRFRTRLTWAFFWLAFVVVMSLSQARCASPEPIQHVVYPPPNCIFPNDLVPVICWVELPDRRVVVYNGQARLLCEDQGPHRWLVVDRQSHEKLQIVGGHCTTFVRVK